MTRDDTEIVSALQLSLADKVGQERFELWFGANTRLDFDDDALTVRVPNQFFQEWLRANFRQQIEASCQETLGKLVPVRFHIDDALGNKPAPAATAKQAAAGSDLAMAEANRAERPTAARRRFANLESFVVGASNRLAWVAAQSVAARLGVSSPLVLHGPTSAGKTHLLEGIYTDVKRLRAGAQVVYLSAEQFTTFFLEALHGSGLPSFRRKYRGLDLLIIDDIQFLAGKRATLTELLHTIDSFLREGRQLVFAADRPPSELSALGPEFVTRLQGGLVCGVDLPEYETRLGMVRQLAGRLELSLSDEVQEFVAANIATHARELSGALNRLDATSRALQKPITLALAEQTLAESIRRQSRGLRLTDIEQAVCEVFGLEPRTLQSNRKGKHVNHPRMLAMWLARKHTRAALSEIGHFFGGRSHSTVISAQKKVSDWMTSGAPF
ncbi:MAG TPA: chromosomal replication initiator protein DnaA, partial [Pirellulales bacterium]|nr:chromosomal replication initiator protein DnaA [Pirellulales bacterium]